MEEHVGIIHEVLNLLRTFKQVSGRTSKIQSKVEQRKHEMHNKPNLVDMHKTHQTFVPKFFKHNKGEFLFQTY